MKEKEATDSQTALVGQKGHESKKSGSGTGPLDTLSRKLSGRSKSSTTGDKQATTAAPSEKPITSTSMPAATASSSTPANATARSANTLQTKKPPQKKKKRSGFSGFLLKLGCLSADEFEDPEPRKGTTSAKPTQTPGSSASTPAAPKNASTTVDTKAPLTKEVKPQTPPAEQDAKPVQPAPSPTILATPVGERQDRSGESPVKPDDQIVVAPHEPTTAPTDEARVELYKTSVGSGRWLTCVDGWPDFIGGPSARIWFRPSVHPLSAIRISSAV